MYECFRDFEAGMEELVSIIEPYAAALELRLMQEQELFRDTELYWEETFRNTGVEAFVSTFTSEAFLAKMSSRTRVAVLLMDSDLLTAVAAHSPLALEYNILYIGCAIPANGLPRSRGGDVETVGNMLKCIGDKKRLEILRRLAAAPSYGLELAEDMGMDSGHMSRILSQMHGYGFLIEEKDRLRVYYRTDHEAIRSFLDMVENTIFAN
jgi:DNA-binding transcriptional ArsR family regulator